MTVTNQHETERRYDELYERYGKPFEQEHRGEYLAISPQGETLLGAILLDVAQQATDTFGPGHYIFKVGERSVGRWR